MKRLLLALPLFALSALALPTDAHAKLGFTAYPFGGEYSKSGALYASPFMYVPSVDWKQDDLLFQIHLFELIDGVFLGEDFGGPEANLGLNVYQTSAKKTISERVDGVVQYGGSLDLSKNLQDTDDTGGGAAGEAAAAATGAGALRFALGASARVGAQIVGGMGMGMYVCPTIGIAYVDADGSGDADGQLGLLGGGTLQVSVWVK